MNSPLEIGVMLVNLGGGFGPVPVWHAQNDRDTEDCCLIHNLLGRICLIITKGVETLQPQDEALVTASTDVEDGEQA